MARRMSKHRKMSRKFSSKRKVSSKRKCPMCAHKRCVCKKRMMNMFGLPNALIPGF